MSAEATWSVCPVCLARVEARREARGDAVHLVKTCPAHGSFEVPVWRGPPGLAAWTRPKIPARPPAAVASTGQGCPFDCGLCEAHGQRTCTVLVEVTSRCDLGCPVCFADAGSGKDMESDPGLDDIGRMLARARELAGPCTLQLSGGEPCVRDDLPDVVARAAGLGFGLVQLNTNGLRIARDGRFAADLAGAGLGSAFLQFDGVDDGPYLALRGRSLVRDKLAAVERLAGLGIGVVLVATLKPGVNDQALGDLLRFAVAAGPGVRGLHFQPVSYFGRYPAPPRDRDRLPCPRSCGSWTTRRGAWSAWPSSPRRPASTPCAPSTPPTCAKGRPCGRSRTAPAAARAGAGPGR
jgi:uncharacterized radical SAM superfamily Fe-S cluster-containing enzyme